MYPLWSVALPQRVARKEKTDQQILIGRWLTLARLTYQCQENAAPNATSKMPRS